MPRTPPSRGRDYRGDRTTPRRGPRSESEYSEYSEDGPTLFGSLLRTLMAGGAVVAVAILAKIERDQRNGVAPKPRVANVVGARPIDVSRSVAGSKGSYQIKEGDCLYRIAVNRGIDPDALERMNPELASRPHYLQPGELVRIP